MTPIKGLLLSLGAFVVVVIVVLVLWALIGPATALIVLLIASGLAVLATIWLVRAITQTIDPG
jgi:hypothetical protein